MLKRPGLHNEAIAKWSRKTTFKDAPESTKTNYEQNTLKRKQKNWQRRE